MWGILGFAACFSPSAPAGAPCQPDENDCPASQTCELAGGGYYCTTGTAVETFDAPTGFDATSSPLDAAADAPPDSSGSMPPPPSFTFVQASTTKPTDVSTMLTLPDAVNTHDAIIVCLNYPDSNGATLESITDTENNTYLTIVGPVDGAGDIHYIAMAKNVRAATSDTLTVTLAAAPTGGADLFALEYSGISTTTAVDTSSYATGSGTAMNSGSATTHSAPELILGYAEAPSASAGSGFTKRALQTGNLVEDKVANPAGSYSATATTTAGAWTMLMVTFEAH
jgi:hypothetical protein